jgi:hypothetical protein
MANDVADGFEAGFVDWYAKLQANEWYFSDLRSSLVGSLTSSTAFENIDAVSDLLLRLSDHYLRAEAGTLFLDIVFRAATTEMPPKLTRNWNEVLIQIQPTQAIELEGWYRRTS